MMKKVLSMTMAIGVLTLLFTGAGCARKAEKEETGKAPAQKQIQIAVVPKGTTHVFWQSVYAGAKQAAEEAGNVKIFWNGPSREGDREQQIQIIEDFIIQKVDGVVFAPNDSKALIPMVEKMYNTGMPCVIIDSGIDTDKYVSFAATDNYEGGVIAARRMGKILRGQGKVVVVKFVPGSGSTTERENGFIETIKKEFPGIQIVDTQYGMDTVETALQTAEDLLTKNSELNGLFACNGSTTIGSLQALRSQGRAGAVKLVGFDAEQTLVDGLREGVIDSLIVQNPRMMGYEGVKAVLAKLNGEEVPHNINTGVELVTQANIDTPKIKQLLGLQE